MGSKCSRMNMTKDKSTNKEMFIMRQRENEVEATSSVDIFEDEESTGRHNSLQNKIGEQFTLLFERKRPSGYRAENLTMSTFVALISSIQSTSWTITATNAYLDVQTNEIVTTFYFERPSKFPDGGALSSPPIGSPDVNRSLHASNIAPNGAAVTGARPLLSMTNVRANGAPISTIPLLQTSRDPESLGIDRDGLDVLKKADRPNKQQIITDKLPTRISADIINDRQMEIVNKDTSPLPPVRLSSSPETQSLSADMIVVQDSQISEHANINDAMTSSNVSVTRTITTAAAVATAPSGGLSLPHSSILPAPRTASSPARGSVAVDDKNAAFFKRMKEEEAIKKQQEAEKESKMDPTLLAVLRGAREQQMQHDANKTAHYSRLGENFLATREAGKGPAHVLVTGRGRGSGLTNFNSANSL